MYAHGAKDAFEILFIQFSPWISEFQITWFCLRRGPEALWVLHDWGPPPSPLTWNTQGLVQGLMLVELASSQFFLFVFLHLSVLPICIHRMGAQRSSATESEISCANFSCCSSKTRPPRERKRFQSTCRGGYWRPFNEKLSKFTHVHGSTLGS